MLVSAGPGRAAQREWRPRRAACGLPARKRSPTCCQHSRAAHTHIRSLSFHVRAASDIRRPPAPVVVVAAMRSAREAARLACVAARRAASSSASGAPPRAALAAVYRSHGVPSAVVALETLQLPPLGPSDALVRMLAAPVNPADLNQVEGRYPTLPPLPAVGGGEGVGVVEALGDSVRGLAIGVRVLLLGSLCLMRL